MIESSGLSEEKLIINREAIAVIDLNGDSNPEIAVKILDNCSDNKCQTTILYNNGDSWLEIFNHSSEKLSLKKELEVPPPKVPSKVTKARFSDP